MAYATLPKERITGRSIDLRPADVGDAEFVLALRLDPALNRHLNATAPAVEPQREWIQRCRADPGQYYFVIENK
ncbi:MAG: hypothetical protein JWP29_1571, partial [Rhodoferax sp.]|nr:hypothetical protein [Rhodoferax sp.]